MTKKDFTDINKMLKHLQREATITIQQRNSNVENVAKHEFIEAINDGYDMYDPRQYERQREQGGLSDPDKFDVTPISDGIAIENTRKGVDGNGTPVNVLEVWEGNAPWGIPDIYGYGYKKNRNVIENTRERLKNSKSLINGFKLDLRNKGFKVE